MSGFLNKAETLFSAASQLFGGAGTVQLGSVVFNGIEVPEHIIWSGKQTIARNRQPGGAVNMYAMGIDFPPIAWTGYFEGLFAITRSRQLYAALNAGNVLTLSWNDRRYSVMIADYQATDHRPNWIEYRISCEVLRDETLPTPNSKPGLIESITGDILTAVGVTPDDLAAVSGGLAKVQTALPLIGHVTGATGITTALAGALSNVQTVTGTALTLANTTMGTLATAASTGDGILPSGIASIGSRAVRSAAAGAERLAALPVVSGLLGRVGINIGNAGA